MLLPAANSGYGSPIKRGTNNGPKLLALDVGTTAVKAALFTAGGELLALGTREYDLEKPSPDRVELDPEIYWKASCDCIADCLGISGTPPDEVKSMAITGQAETLIVVDEAGRPLRKAIVWLDNRARDEARSIAGLYEVREIHAITGQHEIVPCWPACKLLWISQNEPKVFARAARFLMVEDYLAWRLTGVYATDPALNPSTLYLDIRSRQWYPPMLKTIGIDASQLPSLVPSGGRIGNVIDGRAGLSSQTALVAAPLDQICGSIGAGCIKSGMVSETTGCALAVCALTSDPVPDPRRRFGFYLHGSPGQFALLPWAPVAGMLLKNFRDQLGRGSSYAELDAEAADAPCGSEGLIILPHCAGTVTPEANPDAKGVAYGFTMAHTRGHFTRAILESVAYLLREQVELVRESGSHCAEIRSLGGAASSALWLQIKADVLDRPVVTTTCAESTSLGAAMLAAVGAGLYQNLEEAAEKMVSLKARINPIAENVRIYEKCYQNYLALNSAMSPLYSKITHD